MHLLNCSTEEQQDCEVSARKEASHFALLRLNAVDLNHNSPVLANIVCAALRDILQPCQWKELKSELGVAYIFGLRGLVHLFGQSHFLCPPPRFICTGLGDAALGRGVDIFAQGLFRAAGELFDEAPLASSRTFKLSAAARCLPQLVVFGPAGPPSRTCDSREHGKRSDRCRRNKPGEVNKRLMERKGEMVLQEAHAQTLQPLTSGAVLQAPFAPPCAGARRPFVEARVAGWGPPLIPGQVFISGGRGRATKTREREKDQQRKQGGGRWRGKKVNLCRQLQEKHQGLLCLCEEKEAKPFDGWAPSAGALLTCSR